MNQKSNRQQLQQKQSTKLVAAQVSRSGPLPSAQEFEIYERTVPGLGSRIMIMAEKDQQSNLDRLNRSNIHEIGLRYLGMVCAFMIVMAFCGLIYLAIKNNMEWTASIISIAGIATLISKFIIK
jgi:uncharacterized membrane protein